MMTKLLLCLLVMVGVSITLSVDQKKLTGEMKIKRALQGLDVAKAKQKRKLLVFSVTRGYRHGSIPMGQMAMRLMREKTGAYKVIASDDLVNFEPGNIDQFDAICFLTTTMEVFSHGKEELKKMTEGQKTAAAEREI